MEDALRRINPFPYKNILHAVISVVNTILSAFNTYKIRRAVHIMSSFVNEIVYLKYSA